MANAPIRARALRREKMVSFVSLISVSLFLVKPIVPNGGPNSGLSFASTGSTRTAARKRRLPPTIGLWGGI
jgi:hypothetical protein